MKLFVTMLAACAALSGLAGTTAKGATENWVKVQIANATNAVYTRIGELHTAQTVTNTAGDVETTLETENTKMVIAEADRGALRIDNCTPAAVSVGLTNNMIFAYTADDWRYYVNGHKWIDVISTDATNSVGQKTGVVVTSYALTIGQLALTSRVFGDVYYLCDSVGNKYCSLHGAYITNAEAARLLEYYQPNTGRVAWYDRALDFIGRLLIPSACAAPYRGDFNGEAGDGLLHKDDVEAKLGGYIFTQYIDLDGQLWECAVQYSGSDFWAGGTMVTAQNIRLKLQNKVKEGLAASYGEDITEAKANEVSTYVMANVGEAAVAQVIAIVTQCRLENVSRQVAKVYNPVEGLKSQPTAAYVNSSMNWTDSGDDPDGNAKGVNGEPYEKSRGSWTYQKINNFLNAITEGDETQLLDNKTLNKTQNGVGDRRWQLYNFDGSLADAHVAESDLIGLLNANIKDGSGGQADIGNLQRRVWLVCKTKDGDGNTHLDYVPFAYANQKLQVAGVPTDAVSVTNIIKGSVTNLAIKGWHDDMSVGDLLTAADNAGEEEEYGVVVRHLDDSGNSTLQYRKIGKEYSTVTNTLELIAPVTNTVKVATNVLFGANGVTNTLYSQGGLLSTLYGYYQNPETGEKVDAGNFGGITNVFTANINVSNGFDGQSVWTNGARQVEIKGFATIADNDPENEYLPFAVLGEDGKRSVQWKQGLPATGDNASIWTNTQGLAEIKGFEKVENTTEYDYYPLRRFDGDDAKIVWSTNAVPAIIRALGLKRVPNKSETADIWGVIDGLIEGQGLLAKMYGETGVVQRLNKAINIDNAYDNQSVWTNGAAQVEIKGYQKAGENTVPIKTAQGLVWGNPRIPKGDAQGQQSDGTFLDSVETYDAVYQSQTNTLISITGFKDAEIGDVPHKAVANNGVKYIEWKKPTCDIDDKFITTNSEGKATFNVNKDLIVSGNYFLATSGYYSADDFHLIPAWFESSHFRRRDNGGAMSYEISGLDSAKVGDIASVKTSTISSNHKTFDFITPTTIPVITNLSLSVSNGRLSITMMKCNAKVVGVSGGDTAYTGIDLTSQKVITDTKYSTSTHSFTKDSIDVYTLGTKSEQTGVNVFTATEYGN